MNKVFISPNIYEEHGYKHDLDVHKLHVSCHTRNWCLGKRVSVKNPLILPIFQLHFQPHRRIELKNTNLLAFMNEEESR